MLVSRRTVTTPDPAGEPELTFIDLEFDTTASSGTPLGDIAASLMSLHELLRDLATLAAPFTAEFREIQVVAIEMRNPLTIKLSLLAISAEAVKAFQDICRDVIAKRSTNLHTALDPVLRGEGNNGVLTEPEAQRLHGHIATLQNAAIPLKRVVVRED